MGQWESSSEGRILSLVLSLLLSAACPPLDEEFLPPREIASHTPRNNGHRDSGLTPLEPRSRVNKLL